MEEAAAEIDRLRAELTRTQGDMMVANMEAAEKIVNLEDENAKLKEVLKPFANLRISRFMTNGLCYSFRVDVAWLRAARIALNERRGE
jgi:hypothetical protein